MVTAVSTADKIGLLPGFGWLFGDHSFVVTLLICWAISPGMMFVIGIIGESRLIPIAPSRQFMAFFQGDLLVGAMVAGLLVSATQLPSEQRWYNSLWFHLVVFVAMLAIAFWMTWGEYRNAAVSGYGARAMYSPTKIYHNAALIWIYGYVAVSTLVAVLAEARSRGVWAALACGLLWLGLMHAENAYIDKYYAGHGLRQAKAAGAHTSDWQPIWVTGRIRA